MSASIEKHLFTAAATWTAVGLLAGLGYRELTRTVGFSGRTQLSVAHTHALVLGTVMMLLVLILTRVFSLASDGRLGYFVGFWNAGLVITVGMLITKGTLQVLGSGVADSKALAGIAGLGHILLAGSFVLLFVILRRAIFASPGQPEPDAADVA